MPKRSTKDRPTTFECNAQLKAIDFFCGAGGMSFGLQEAGIKILGGIDVDESCRQTYESNISGSCFLATDVTLLSVDDLAERLGVHRHDDDLILVGCSPCQFWSKVNTDKTKSRRSAFLLREFSRFVNGLNPGWVVIENVPGILNRKGSALPSFIRLLRKLGYTIAHAMLDLSQHGVPQTRHRFLLIATRLGMIPELPMAAPGAARSVRDFIGAHNGFVQVPAGHEDCSEFMHTVSMLSDINLLRIRSTPKDGGDRRAWEQNPVLRVNAHEGKSTHFADVYSRMAWDRPAPTITTRFNSYSNGRFGHPEEDRAISLREGATLQTFPKSYLFYGSKPAIARQIGNAVPPIFATTLGQQIFKQHAMRQTS